MDYFTVGLLAWTAVFILLGIARGFWKALAAALGLVGAYAASASFAPDVSQFLLRIFASANLGETVTWAVSAVLIFMLSGLLIRLIVVLLGRSWPVTNRPLNALSGGALSGCYGFALGLLCIWSISFVFDTYYARRHDAASSTNTNTNTSTNTNTNTSTHAPQQSPAVALAREFVSTVVRWNALRGGATEQTAQLAAAYAKQPKEVLDAVQDSVRSSEFKEIVGSDEIRQIVRNQDAQGLQRSPQFAQLMKQPAVQKLRALIEGEDSEWNDEAVAQKMVQVWTEVDAVVQSPEVDALINDPQVQAFLRDGGELSPTLLKKAETLLRAMATGKGELVSANELYQWHNAEGQLEVTKFNEIPQDKKASAQKITF